MRRAMDPGRALVFESIVAGVYVSLTRGLAPIFLVSLGYTMSDLLRLNIIGAVLMLSTTIIVYRFCRGINCRGVLYASYLLERIMWLLVALGIYDPTLASVFYVLALSMVAPTTIMMAFYMLSCLGRADYRRIASLRSAYGFSANIAGQVLMIAVLFMVSSMFKYMILYIIGFLSGILGYIFISRLPSIRYDNIGRGDAEAEAEATSIFIVLALMLSSMNLISVIWVPRLMSDLGAPDYMAAAIGLIQSLSSIAGSLFWTRRSMRDYRYSVIILALIPMLVYLTPIPIAHLGIAALYGFSLVGANLFAGIMYSGLVGRMNVFKSATLLSLVNTISMLLGSSIAYIALSLNTMLVFATAALLGIAGLILGLTTISEISPLPRDLVRMYSRILYNSSITGYNFMVFTLNETLKAAIRIMGLTIAFSILLFIYKILYYMMAYSG